MEKNDTLKHDTIYFSDNMLMPIEEYDNHKDLGVIMDSDGTFNTHINLLIKKLRKKIGWVLRSFYSRNIEFMRQIFISLIRPHMDYCAQLWAPSEGPMLDKLEKILYDYTKYIPEICNLSYERRLKAMKLQSVQRRYDRYRILYTRKCALDLVPNCNIIIRRDATYRNGTTMEVPPLKGMSKLERLLHGQGS